MDINSYKQNIADLKAIADKILVEIENDFNQLEADFEDRKKHIIEERNNKIAKLTRDKNKEIDEIKESKDLEIKNMRNAVLKAIE